MPRHTMQRGFAYVEVLLSVLLTAILLVPALQALTGAIAGSSASLTARQFALRGKLEEALSQPFGKLYAQTYLAGGNTASSVSVTFSDLAGSTDRRVLVLYRFDAATGALSANDTGLLYLSAYYEADGSGGALNTLAGRWW